MQKKWAYGLLFFCFFSLFFYNWYRVQYNCLNAADLGLYSQAIQLLAMGDSNPFLTVRGLHIFNDHFEPILFLGAIWSKLWGGGVNSVLSFEMVFFALTLGLIYKGIPRKAGTTVRLGALFLFLFCKGILLGLTFPVHPSTWAILPCVFLVWLLYHRPTTVPILLTTLFLCLFREEFPFAMLSLGFYFGLCKQWTKSLLLILLAAGLLLGIFYLRPLWLGPTISYGAGMITGLLHHPWDTLQQAVGNFKWGQAKIYLPFVLPTIYILQREFRGKIPFHHPAFAVLFFLAPMLLIRFLANSFMFHYSAPPCGVWLALLVFAPSFFTLVQNKKMWFLTRLVFILTASSSYTKIWNTLVQGKNPQCTISAAHALATTRLLQTMEQLPLTPAQKILATGGIIPRTVNSQRHLLHLGGMSLQAAHYDFILWERHQSGDTWPLNENDIESLWRQCRPYGKKILQEDEFYLFAQGPFPQQCLAPIIPAGEFLRK